MVAFDSDLGKFTITARLFNLVSNMPAEKQFILLKSLLRQNITTYLYKLIIEMPEEQQTHLLEHLGEMADRELPVTTIELDNYESSMRANPRKPCLIKVACRIQNSSFNSHIIDISTVGVFIETNTNFSVGQKIALKFNIPNQQHPIQLNGVIAWNGLQGIGVKFSSLTDFQKKTIQAFVNVR
ncbi:MAG: PilZ domain-containing protein [Desulfobacterales bacterium]|nr:MAG: PilZ domain-containing protein [Desulfobacterales bacterium]